MSEEVTGRGIISLTPEVNKPRSGARRNSTGKASNTVSTSLSNSGEKPVPNYLRASTGSCHDFCKFGIKHGFETKKRSPISIKFPGNNGTSDEGQNQARPLMPQERRKRPGFKYKLSQALYGHTDKVITPKDLPTEKVIQLSDTPTNQEEGSSGEFSGVELKISFPGPTTTTVASLEHKPANLVEESSKGSITIKFPAEGLCEEPVRIQSHASNTQKTAEHTPVVQVEEQYVVCVVGSVIEESLLTKTGIALAEEHVVSSLAEESSDEPEIITSPFHESIASAEHSPTDQAEGLSEEQNQVKILNAGERKKGEVNKLRTSQKKAETSVRAKVIKQKTSDASIKKKTASSVTKTITSVKPTSTRQKITSFVNKAIAPLANSIIKQKAPPPPKAGDVSAEPTTSLKHKESASPSISTVDLTGRRNQEKKIIGNPGQSKIGAEEVPKPLKTCVSTKPPVIRVPSMKLRKFRSMKPSCPVRSQAKVVKVDRSAEKQSKTPYAVELKPGKVDQKTTKQKPSKSLVSLQSENNGPRKLKFRPAKVLSESQNGKNLGRRNFRKQRDTGSEASNTPTSDAPAIVLRHQDLQEKKDTQGLFNHVIEETVSKLLQTRKSRVKALVGAFETLISLQENKLAGAVAVP